MGILIFLVVLLAVVVLFSVQNASSVSVTLLIWKFDASLAIVLFLALTIGVVVGAVIVLWTRRRHGKPVRSPTAEPSQSRTEATDQGGPNRV